MFVIETYNVIKFSVHARQWLFSTVTWWCMSWQDGVTPGKQGMSVPEKFLLFRNIHIDWGSKQSTVAWLKLSSKFCSHRKSFFLSYLNIFFLNMSPILSLFLSSILLSNSGKVSFIIIFPYSLWKNSLTMILNNNNNNNIIFIFFCVQDLSNSYKLTVSVPPLNLDLQCLSLWGPRCGWIWSMRKSSCMGISQITATSVTWLQAPYKVHKHNDSFSKELHNNIYWGAEHLNK